jgi:hypothetical protein
MTAVKDMTNMTNMHWKNSTHSPINQNLTVYRKTEEKKARQIPGMRE